MMRTKESTMDETGHIGLIVSNLIGRECRGSLASIYLRHVEVELCQDGVAEEDGMNICLSCRTIV